MIRTLEDLARRSLKKALSTLNYPIVDIRFEEPPTPELGDLATTISFELASKLKKNPVEISKTIIGVVKLPPLFEKVEAKGPYINFFIDYQNFSRKLLDSIDEDYGRLPEKGEKVILEHTSANPNGPLHIGHIRNAIIGDSLARILKFAGYNVETHYYVNDMGRQIAMIVWGLLNLQKGLEDYPGDKWDHKIGRLYYEVNKYLEKNPRLKNEIDELIRSYEKGERESIFQEAVEKCLEGIKKTLKGLYIKHDKFVWESKFVRDGSVQNVLEKLKKTNYIKEDDVLYLDLEDFGIDKELILTRSDGTSLYSTRDLAYHLYKSNKCDIIIDILGSDHKLAVKQLEAAIGLLGGKRPEVIFYEFITLPEGSMSTRRGVFVSVDDLIDEARSRAVKEIKKRRKDLKREEIEDIADKIGVGAIRYYIARLSPEKHLVFKWDEALNFEMGCASIQYAHARACKLLKKALFTDDVEIEGEWSPNELERDLIRLLAKFPGVVRESAENRRVHLIAQYLQELANAFHKFYKFSPVIGSEFEGARLILVDRVKKTIRNGLKLLGIEVPATM
ncbi:MAG TPA: arginine--tRNA ligase [Methanothermobacter sp.]|jgi:arginyl-tRNA synthetase|uniref:Arginine--tRNA ligase n=1 Tax=Methanothermobacter tenebrarum TaxID=680118 RepID=A0ABM7YBD9_9EURY|nr:arginine--tRNA ligase [Methanothermobacter tenebrarum]MDD3454136.1 arginine--tRNA ligase [Methanobacteriales archaeon]MDI6882606.1 arginine--tRNA ligase [Methanothermobacter sp.]MDX9693876.1 arginine--tRNA ligase [Methanothermobacter sp.]BDH78646.1 arginine--tRNA ligase [Methanothermobacter tenebrarum]HHW16322.1 arginine--tRNA ligase [Methanothermobacter sp.]